MSMVEQEYFEQFDEPTDDDSDIIGKAALTIREVAIFCRCSEATVRRAIAAKRLAVIKPNGKHGKSLVWRADMMSWLKRCRIAAVGE